MTSIDEVLKRFDERKAVDVKPVDSGVVSGVPDLKKPESSKDDEPVVEPEKVVDEDTKFTVEERRVFNEKFLKNAKKKGNLRMRERKMIKNAEYDSTSGKTKEIVIGLAVVGIVLIFLSKEFLPNDLLYALLIIVGASFFFPIGMLAGWFIFDPVMRCKMIRKMTKKNYGVINFVSEGSKIFSKIKNFDSSLIWRNNECWVVASSRVYQMSKDGNAINNGKQIDKSKIITLVDTVPVLFLDVHSMEPLSLSTEGRSYVYPAEIGSALKAWVDNQRAKMLAIKKMEDMVTLIIIGACVGAIILSYITMTEVQELASNVDSMHEKMQFIIDNINLANPP